MILHSKSQTHAFSQSSFCYFVFTIFNVKGAGGIKRRCVDVNVDTRVASALVKGQVL